MEALAHESERPVDDVRPPALARLEPGEHALLELGEQEEEVLGLALLGRRSGELRAWVDEVDRIERRAARIALVPARAVGSAARAGPLDVAVREEAQRDRIERLHRRAGLEQTVLVQTAQHLLRGRRMVLGERRREEVERDAELVPVTQELGMEAFYDRARRG